MELKPSFTRYQRFVICVLAVTQFTVVLDFMIISPLGDVLMKALDPFSFATIITSI